MGYIVTPLLYDDMIKMKKSTTIAIIYKDDLPQHKKETPKEVR